MTLASGLLFGRTHFLHWGVIQISLANFLVIVLMLVTFVLALVLPFPHGPEVVPEPAAEGGPSDGPE
ncbi:MAG: hypothetical protein QOI51_475 [Nocardioidaceae bacterium]|jgi:hypothetical protein|nr:hypothetical protein [Nocardioidaceae bacterium]MDX6310043.1 hypothetical protein [Nocardioidaceae bacterium]